VATGVRLRSLQHADHCCVLLSVPGELLPGVLLPCDVGRTQPLVIKADHYYPGSKGRDVVVILYAQLGRHVFNSWHRSLAELAANGDITYILRHYVTAVSNYGLYVTF